MLELVESIPQYSMNPWQYSFEIPTMLVSALAKYIGLLFWCVGYFNGLPISFTCYFEWGYVPQKKRDSGQLFDGTALYIKQYFEVTSDSLMLQQLPLVDVLPVFKGERLVVAEFMIQAADSVDSVW